MAWVRPQELYHEILPMDFVGGELRMLRVRAGLARHGITGREDLLEAPDQVLAAAGLNWGVRGSQGPAVSHLRVLSD